MMVIAAHQPVPTRILITKNEMKARKKRLSLLWFRQDRKRSSILYYERTYAT